MISEFQIIDRIKTWLNNRDLIIPIGDDTAAFELAPGHTTLFTADSLVDKVHFKIGSIKPVDLGYKSLAVNISDIAAMGGIPKYSTVSLGIPKAINLAFIKNFYKGLTQASRQFKVKIVGGDLTASSELFISISLIGQVDKSNILKRSAAKAGDVILITGELGSSAAGLEISKISNLSTEISTKDTSYLLEKHFRPAPRIKEAQLAATLGVKTAIDISDGFVSDCRHLCEASGVGCTIFAEKVPIAKALVNFAEQHGLNPLQLALSGGEDYELIFTAPKSVSSLVINKFKNRRWPIFIVGEITKNKTINVLNKAGEPINWKKGYEHFVK